MLSFYFVKVMCKSETFGYVEQGSFVTSKRSCSQLLPTS